MLSNMDGQEVKKLTETHQANVRPCYFLIC